MVTLCTTLGRSYKVTLYIILMFNGEFAIHLVKCIGMSQHSLGADPGTDR